MPTTGEIRARIVALVSKAVVTKAVTTETEPVSVLVTTGAQRPDHGPEPA